MHFLTTFWLYEILLYVNLHLYSHFDLNYFCLVLLLLIFSCIFISFLFFPLPHLFPNCPPCLHPLEFIFLFLLNKQEKHIKKMGVWVVLANYSWTLGLPLCVVDIISVIPLKKVDFPFLKAINFWIGLEFVCLLPPFHAGILSGLRLYKTCVHSVAVFVSSFVQLLCCIWTILFGGHPCQALAQLFLPVLPYRSLSLEGIAYIPLRVEHCSLLLCACCPLVSHCFNYHLL